MLLPRRVERPAGLSGTWRSSWSSSCSAWRHGPPTRGPSSCSSSWWSSRRRRRHCPWRRRAAASETWSLWTVESAQVCGRSVCRWFGYGSDPVSLRLCSLKSTVRRRLGNLSEWVLCSLDYLLLPLFPSAAENTLQRVCFDVSPQISKSPPMIYSASDV